ncbi:sugar kinase [Shewanella sp. 5_MG-2023]|uniref:sugar kinase n=1 Tax=Shewanella sp. 5_MG-2023 TaxID=3062656 RepID=UPI0026E2CA6A|nr:sugar kinase [Shewanella sp. 5_MG-2023]MDO6641660.1 sugar kinase [Shewanella sp. 5_MG-2023]
MSSSSKNGVALKSIVAIGECMMELIPHGDNQFIRGYAGDTYNALVYAKRFAPQLTCEFFTAIGHDPMSQDMMTKWHSEGVDSSKAFQLNGATIGVYSINVDENGERSFSYWRKHSAATQMLHEKSVDEIVNHLSSAELIFYSGISLAILSDVDKAKLMTSLATLRQQGVKVAFDPNYRQAMWCDVDHATHWLTEAYRGCDIALPGIEEHSHLFQQDSAEQISQFCTGLGVQEVIVKAGKQGTYGYSAGEMVTHIPFKAAPVQVDSTAAGDSFAGTYLAARAVGFDIEQAIIKACFIASEVVQFKGAILPKTHYNALIKQ